MASTLSPTHVDRLMQELASFARSGIPVPEGLRALSRQLKDADLRALTAELATATEAGKPLSMALENASAKRVPHSLIAVIRCAEETGRPAAIFEFALEHARRLRRHRDAIYSAALYPLAVLATLVLVATAMFRTVFLKLSATFTQFGGELPFLTKFVGSVAEPVTGEYGWWVAFAIVAIILIPVAFVRGREWFVTTVCRVPSMGSIATSSDTAIVMKFLAETLQRGVPFPVALEGAATAAALPYTRSSLLEMARAAERGERVSGYVYRTMPPTARYLFENAEQRGDLPEACADIATYCEDRFEVQSRRAIVILEPILTFIVAMAVLTFVVSMYLPMFRLPGMVR